jgi:peptidoglycan hydrolase-like protein with peptidoglycan-binding domain
VVTAADGGGRVSRLRRRRVIVLVIVVLAVLAAVGELLLTSQIKSPAEQAAQTRPPAATQLTATVQRTVLTRTVLAQGAVGAPKEFTPSQVGGSGGGGSGGATGGQDVQEIVTHVFCRKGSLASQGSVLLEVAGQPFFVLQGTVPAYRDLAPGEIGEDVAQLQQDLISLGFGTGSDTLGSYGPGTAAAVSAYYQAHGYAAPVVTAGTKKHPVRLAFVPLGDFSFVPSLPATVIKVGATVGKAPASGALTLALGSPKLTGQLSPSTAGLVRPGMRVTITDSGGGPVRHGQVAWVSHSTASNASISGGLYVKMGIALNRPLPMSLVGQDVSLAIGAARSRGPVLAVPEAAVFAAADGRTYVSKVSGGRTVRVPVRVGMSGSGLLQVTPDQPGELAAGDQVVTGQNFAAVGGAGGLVRPGGVPSPGLRPRGKVSRGPG